MIKDQQNIENTIITEQSALSDENDKFSNLSTSALLAKVDVPRSHVLVADNYMVIKKIYGSPVVKSRINNQEKALLAKYDFNQLEYSTIKQINEELALLKKWSMSQDANLKNDSDEIINIRCKELKYLAANRYTLITNEIYNGYMALEKYFEDTECWGRTRLSKGESNKILIARNHLKNPIYVGDTAGDYQSAVDAGIPFVYAAYGFGEVQDCAYEIQSIRELPEVLERVQ